MGDDQRLQRINANIVQVNILINNLKIIKRNFIIEIQNCQGDLFIELFQVIAEIDQHIWNLNVEKQRLNNLII